MRCRAIASTHIPEHVEVIQCNDRKYESVLRHCLLFTVCIDGIIDRCIYHLLLGHGFWCLGSLMHPTNGVPSPFSSPQ